MIDGAILNLKPVVSEIPFSLDRFSLFRLRSSLSEAYFVPLGNTFQTDVFVSGEIDPRSRPGSQNPACELSLHNNIRLLLCGDSSVVNDLRNDRIGRSFS